MRAEPRKRRSLSRNVWATGLVSLLTDISSEMLVPILPLFLSSVLGAPVSVIGLIEGAAETTASLMKAFAGWLSDRTGRRKPLMIFGYGLSNLLKPLMGLATTWGHVLTIRMADRFGKGVRGAPRDAMIADSSDHADRGRAFGLHRTMDTIGAALGPLLAWLILTISPGEYRQVFWWAAVPGALSVIVLLLLTRETGSGVAKTGPMFRGWSLSFQSLNPELRRLLLISFLFALGNSSDAFLVLRARGLGLATAVVPLAYFAFNVSYSILSYPVGALSDRVGRKPVIIGGFLFFALVYLGFGLANESWMAWPLFLLYGLYYAATEGVQKAYVTDLAPTEQRGTALGVFNALTGVAALPASLIAGLLWDRLGEGAPFFLGSATAAASAVLLLLWGGRGKQLRARPYGQRPQF